MKVLDRLEMLQSLNDKQEQTITILRKQVDESQKICDLYKSKLETQEKNFQKVELHVLQGKLHHKNRDQSL